MPLEFPRLQEDSAPVLVSSFTTHVVSINVPDITDAGIGEYDNVQLDIRLGNTRKIIKLNCREVMALIGYKNPEDVINHPRKTVLGY